MDDWGLSKKGFKIVFLVDLVLYSRSVIAREPANDLVNFFFRAIFALRFLNIQRINPCKCCRENVMFKHCHSSCVSRPDTHAVFSAKRSGPATGRAADRPLQPVVRSHFLGRRSTTW